METQKEGIWVDEIIRRIERKIEEIECGSKKIMDKLKALMVEHKLRYWCEYNQHSKITAFLEINQKRYDLEIIVDRKTIELRLVFLFNVESDAIPIVSMYIVEFNNKEDVVVMKMNEFGVVSLHTKVDDGDGCDIDVLWEKICVLTNVSEAVYPRLYRMAIGKVPRRMRQLYEELLLSATIRVEGLDDVETDEIEYGIEGAKRIGENNEEDEEIEEEVEDAWEMEMMEEDVCESEDVTDKAFPSCDGEDEYNEDDVEVEDPLDPKTVELMKYINIADEEADNG